MTDKQLQDAIKDAAAESARATVAEFAKSHPCRFSDDTAKTLHEIHESKVAEGADGQTFRILIAFGKDWQDVTKTIRRRVLMWVIVLAVIAAGIVAVKKGWLW